MKQLGSLVLVLTVLAAPVAAQDDDAPGLMQRGAEMFLDGLRKEMAPALDDLQGLADQVGPSVLDFMAEMGPAFRDMLDEVKDWSQYSPPEMLPNGDIIIRRKPDPVPEIAPHPPADGEIDI